jgi:hypothetical protein
LKSLTVADLRRQLDQLTELDLPEDADVFLMPSMNDSFRMPLHGVVVAYGDDGPQALYLTGDIEAPNRVDE